MNKAKTERARRAIETADWRSSRVAEKYEHWYWVQPAAGRAAQRFAALVALINTEGEAGKFAGTRYRYLTVDEFTYWVSRSMFPPYGLIVNRRRADHDQGDGSTWAEDWNEGLDDDDPKPDADEQTALAV